MVAPMPSNNVAPPPPGRGGAAQRPGAANSTASPVDFGWNVPSAEMTRRIVMAIAALEKQGKTHFALTASRYKELSPVFLFNYDNGLEGVVEPFIAAGGEIYTATMKMDPNWDKMSADQKKVQAGALYDDFQKYWAYAVSRGQGTIIVDTHTEEYEVRRLAKFGKLQQVMPQHYAEVNGEFRADVREAYDSGMNIIFTQKLKKEYVNNNWNGRYEPGGFNDLPYLVQANLQAYRDPNDQQFKVLIKDCRQNAALANTLLTGDQCDFGFFLDLVFKSPHFNPVEWNKMLEAAGAAAAAPVAAEPELPPHLRSEAAATPEPELPPHLRGMA